MLDQHYRDPRLTRLYDLGSPWSADRRYFVDLAGDHRRILDVGCGTGLVTTALAAAGHRVSGVDPSRAMLAIARARSGGEKVEWIEGRAEQLPVSGSFDLIIMTGNAFQALLGESQVRTFFERCRESLAQGGRIIFDARNPSVEWASRWDYDVTHDTDDGVVRESRRTLKLRGPVMTFEFRCQFPADTVITTSRIRFWGLEEIEALATGAGLRVEETRADYTDEPFAPSRSNEMVITLGRSPDRYKIET